jgi:uncharacterized protein YecE (DUF72 family)
VDGLGRPAVLTKWLKAGAHSVLYRLDRFDLDAAAWHEVRGGYDALAAEALIFSTRPSFSPSTANRESMKRFFGEVVGDRGGRTLGWEPRGTWEPGQAARLCQELDLLHAYDPLLPEDDLRLPPTENAYFRLHGLGLQRNRLSDERLAELAERVAEHPRAWVIFANLERFRDAQRFQALWAALVAEAG